MSIYKDDGLLPRRRRHTLGNLVYMRRIRIIESPDVGWALCLSNGTTFSFYILYHENVAQRIVITSTATLLCKMKTPSMENCFTVIAVDKPVFRA